jgi:hypothetical protein
MALLFVAANQVRRDEFRATGASCLLGAKCTLGSSSAGSLPFGTQILRVSNQYGIQNANSAYYRSFLSYSTTHKDKPQVLVAMTLPSVVPSLEFDASHTEEMQLEVCRSCIRVSAVPHPICGAIALAVVGPHVQNARALTLAAVWTRDLCIAAAERTPCHCRVTGR